MGESGKTVPGYDFLQGLMRSAGAAMPGMNPWIAPTLDPEELNKRIDELRTVQFWLEQNAKMIGHSIQALEVQRMTLATLKGLNLKVTDLSEAFKLKVPGDEAPAPDDPTSSPAAVPQSTPDKPAAAGPVDPTQWWTALTQQFAEIAAKALPAGSADAARSVADAVGSAVQQQVQAAKQGAVQGAADAPAQASNAATAPPRSSARTPARKPRPRKA